MSQNTSSTNNAKSLLTFSKMESTSTSSKPDQVPMFFGISNPPSPVRMHGTSDGVFRSFSPRPTRTTIASGMLAEVLESLTLEQRELIRGVLPADAISMDAAFAGAYSSAVELEQHYKDKMWSWEYRGRRVYFRSQMEKVVKLLDKLKAIGDAAASIDPTHFGLPWAGFRLILEVRSRNQIMVALTRYTDGI